MKSTALPNVGPIFEDLYNEREGESELVSSTYTMFGCKMHSKPSCVKLQMALLKDVTENLKISKIGRFLLIPKCRGSSLFLKSII